MSRDTNHRCAIPHPHSSTVVTLYLGMTDFLNIFFYFFFILDFEVFFLKSETLRKDAENLVELNSIFGDVSINK